MVMVPTGRYLIISLRGPRVPQQRSEGEISKTGTTASMAKMAIESIDGKGTPPIQESILAPVSPIASFFTRSQGFSDFGMGRTCLSDSTTWFWVFWTLSFEEWEPRQRMVNQWNGLDLQVGRVKKFQHVICNQWRLKSKAEDCGIWCLALTWAGSGCIYAAEILL